MNILFLAIGFVFALSSLTYLAFNSQNREVLLSRFRVPRRKANGAFTPPRSVSPEKNGQPPSQQEKDEIFPPHRREALADLPPGALKGPGKSAKELSEQPPDYSKLTPDKDVCNTNELLYHTTATGFTVEEIRRLGDFPDYARLSGIPLPNAYKEFDITTATPRPYRPYRWPYHQTMCTWSPK